MDKVREMVSLWKKTKSVSDILSKTFVINDIEDFRSRLKILEGQERRETSRLLKEIMASLSMTLEKMKKEKANLGQEIAQRTLRGKACIAYHNQSRIKR